VNLPEQSEQQEVSAAAHALPSGLLTLHADRAHGLLVGAWAVAPDAANWIQFAAIAIRAAVPLDVARDMLQQFPAYGDVYLSAIDQLMLKLHGGGDANQQHG
jgi:pyruvate/2-oxoglutarate dehydrogenase complex dihydrolipoamide dehydrogenase (E3) component